ncbi:transcriptional repressor [Rhodoblastus acidophilus]|uniref:Ferric uptake regulation protein n=1 Tax=Candidatus Rhodoblastus alkanivorans TaxID=2954117 RepID=A0ABS9Z8Q2_9HYPH|nr:Fur family transcriptional regulator [Candidatus Rhodoblastus alkanivorans]MCI4679314.1 transcriptional repressor [Candidatus Rhodoblastus alkanivorans]MCI4684059.1 transcriptional repressor [Candidatus Rhodoblastus alkanivorans]MDI4641379.1 transcriptional repressor [Rhodoblastus acidophilus]
MQTRIRDLLERAQKPLSAYDVIDALREHGRVAPPTVYRALQKLIDEGLAHRLETRNAYVACRDEGHACGHRHRAGFMICRACGRTLEFGDAEIESLLSRAAARSGFSAERVAIEIQGLCASCAEEDASSADAEQGGP